MGVVDDRLVQLGLELNAAPRPVGSYVTLARSRSLAFTAGHGPIRADGTLVTGRVGADVSMDEAVAAARLTGLGLLATLREELGTLDAIGAVVKVFGMVNAVSDFEEHPTVINGCSDLLVEVFGDAGRHARSAVGVASLPMNIPVEIELVAELR